MKVEISFFFNSWFQHGGRNRASTKSQSTKTPQVASVCIPHKVGSYSWGQFARNLTDPSSPSASAWLSLDWKTRAEKSLRVVVVRHPLTRYQPLPNVSGIWSSLSLSTVCYILPMTNEPQRTFLTYKVVNDYSSKKSIFIVVPKSETHLVPVWMYKILRLSK